MIRNKDSEREDLPAPVRPTMPIWKVKLISFTFLLVQLSPVRSNTNTLRLR